jgi:hypothetical protein
MSGRTTRRQFLKASTALVGAAALSGCSSVPLLGSDGSSLKGVPEDAEYVASADVTAFLADDGLTEVANAYFGLMTDSEYYEGPTDMEEALDQYEDETGLDPRKAKSMVSFGEYGGESGYGVTGALDQSYTGLIVESEWSIDDIEDAWEDQGMESLSEDEYGGKTTLTTDSDPALVIGVLEEGTFVFGTEDASEDAIDVWTGEGDGIDSDLKGAYDKSRDGHARFASEVPEGQLPQQVPTGGGDRMDADPLTEVSTTYGSIYADGDTRGGSLNMVAGDEDAAEDISDIMDGGLALMERQVESSGEQAMVDLLDKIDVSREGSTVTITFEATVEELTETVESFG